MGVHHFSLALAPRAYFAGQLPGELSESDFERGEDPSLGWWALHPPSDDLLLAIRSLLPNDRAWPGGEVEEYTSDGEWESDVRIFKEEGRVDGITFRYSPVSSPWSDVQRFLSIARLHGCVLVEVRSRYVLEPDDDTVAETFQASRSAKFTRDPAHTLKEAAAEVRGELPNKSLERTREG
jgi:hypothetical protein